MYQSHGIGYEVYCQKHDVRMKVEKRREKDYILSRQMLAILDRRLFA